MSIWLDEYLEFRFERIMNKLPRKREFLITMIDDAVELVRLGIWLLPDADRKHVPTLEGQVVILAMRESVAKNLVNLIKAMIDLFNFGEEGDYWLSKITNALEINCGIIVEV